MTTKKPQSIKKPNDEDPLLSRRRQMNVGYDSIQPDPFAQIQSNISSFKDDKSDIVSISGRSFSISHAAGSNHSVDVRSYHSTNLIIPHSRREAANAGFVFKWAGRLLNKLKPHMGFVTKCYNVLLFNAVIISLILIISRFATKNGLFGLSLFNSDSPPLLIAANITMMTSFSIQSYLTLRICLSCGMFTSL